LAAVNKPRVSGATRVARALERFMAPAPRDPRVPLDTLLRRQ
jgi:hypothetical protein